MLINGNTLHIPLADKSVHCCISSPPYWGLRDYGLDATGLGLEQTPDEYVAKMVQAFREVWRVLRDDGTCWLNMGDSYAANRGSGASPLMGKKQASNPGSHLGKLIVPPSLKPKDLVGMPWRVAFALQADGWYLRSDIIWHKPNPMPESVTDRPTKSHEYVFLLSKSKRYFYDADAIRENHQSDGRGGFSNKATSKWANNKAGPNGKPLASMVDAKVNPAGRNKRTVWTVATAPYSGAHFATFPPKLIEPMVKAGTSERGVCPECGAPWKRVVERTFIPQPDVGLEKGIKGAFNQKPMDISNSWDGFPRGTTAVNTTGWKPTCPHSHDPIPATVLDPFVGSGTTVQVARSLGRRGIGIDLSPEYLQLARQRLELDKLDDWGKGINDTAVYDNLPLFSQEAT